MPKPTKGKKDLERLLMSEPDIQTVSDSEELAFKKLKYREQRFVIEYCNTYNGKLAAISAGWSETCAASTAAQLLDKPHIQDAVLRRHVAIANMTNMKKEWIMLELAELFEEIKAEPRGDRNIMLKILDMLAKVNGFYQPEVQVNVQNNIDSIKIEIVKPDNGEQTIES